ncbi:MAG: GTP-binding protein [Candidatus Heimdallarchaeota archaeon]|nr:GTP-binding protein [Candidatus Heimdallarchaeota archaeon]
MKLKKEELARLIVELPPEQRRIFSIIAHIDHGKSSTADHLLQRAGLISGKGTEPAISYDPEEKERMMTIFTSLITLPFSFKDKTYLFQLNDTPGHISFTGEVSRALRASDGVITIIDALEGMMVQTETSMRIAIQEEYCKPVLFINKVDRLLGEKRLTTEETFAQLDRQVKAFNSKIKQMAPESLAELWQVSFKDNSVGIGSAKDGWGFTVEILKEQNITPKQVFEKYQLEEVTWLEENLPLHEVLIRLVVQHLPSPKEAQLYKIPNIWQGNIPPEYIEQEVAKLKRKKFIEDLAKGLKEIFSEQNIKNL